MEVVVNGTPIEVKAKPYVAANLLPRFRVSYNESPVVIFGWDPTVKRLVVVDSGTEAVPPPVEQAISAALQRKMAA